MATGVRHVRWAAAVLAALLPLAACGEKEDRGERDAGGESDADVGDGLDNLIAQLDDGVAGQACTKDSDCGGTNARCSWTAVVGETTRSCTGLCDSDEQCGEGGTCVAVARLGGRPISFCQKLCNGDSDCDPELQCSRAFNVYEVLVFISEQLRWVELGSASPTICQERSSTVRMEPGFVGQACTESAMCGGGACIQSPFLPGGYCGGDCLADEHCGIEGGCMRDRGAVTFGFPGMCMLPCSSDSECREAEGYRCLQVPFLAQPSTYCLSSQFLTDLFGEWWGKAEMGADAGAR